MTARSIRSPEVRARNGSYPITILTGSTRSPTGLPAKPRPISSSSRVEQTPLYNSSAQANCNAAPLLASLPDPYSFLPVAPDLPLVPFSGHLAVKQAVPTGRSLTCRRRAGRVRAGRRVSRLATACGGAAVTRFLLAVIRAHGRFAFHIDGARMLRGPGPKHVGRGDGRSPIAWSIQSGHGKLARPGHELLQRQATAITADRIRQLRRQLRLPELQRLRLRRLRLRRLLRLRRQWLLLQMVCARRRGVSVAQQRFGEPTGGG